jgi:hypothetical protein
VAKCSGHVERGTASSRLTATSFAARLRNQRVKLGLDQSTEMPGDRSPADHVGAQATDIPQPDRLLDYLYAPEVDRSPAAFVARYKEIAAVPDPFPIVPAEPTILQKLVWPLRHAQGSYALGNYVGCIALCGMVGEMVAIILWDISKVSLQGQAMGEAQQRAMFGSTFERLGQERRVDVLHALKLVDDTTKAFDRLRAIRRKYLHLLSELMPRWLKTLVWRTRMR